MLTTENTVKWLILFAGKVNEQKVYLSELDSAIGDGDHGTNMARGTKDMEEKLKEEEYATVQDVLKKASMSLLSKIGGASGPLYGSALMAMAKQAGKDEKNIAAILKAGLEGIQKRGKAVPGEKTMVDVWVPVIEALESGNLTDIPKEVSHFKREKGVAQR